MLKSLVLTLALTSMAVGSFAVSAEAQHRQCLVAMSRGTCALVAQPSPYKPITPGN
jgi:hypothetical protein